MGDGGWETGKGEVGRAKGEEVLPLPLGEGRGEGRPLNPPSPPSPPSSLLIQPAGDAAALLVLGDEMSAEMSLRVQAIARAIEQEKPSGVLDLVPAYCTLLVHFDPAETSFGVVSESLETAIEKAGQLAATESRVIEIPTVYGGDHGPDLPEVAGMLGLSEDEVVRRHSEATYLVCFLGFAPGQPYVVGLPPELALPRRANPRERVPAGAVLLANQTNIYPMDNPTGWWWIGRGPAKLFDPAQDPPTLLLPGDQIKFLPVEEAEFGRLG